MIKNATFETVLTQEKTIIDENSAATRVASVALDNPSGIGYTVQITGAGSNSFIYDKDSNELRYNGSADYESQSRYELVLVFTKDNNNEVINIPINIDVNDIDEAPSLTTTLAAANFTESSAVGTTIMTASAPDPEGGTITYSLSGTDAAKFTIDADGTVKIASLLDYETKDNYSITVTATDGTHSLSTAISVSLTNVNEDQSVNVTMADAAITEASVVGTTVAITSVIDPEGGTVTYSLSGTDANMFSIDTDGTVKIASLLDYETKDNYSVIVNTTADGITVSKTISVNVNNVNEAPLY